MSSEDIFDPDSIGLTQGSEPQSQLTTGSEYEASGTSSSCPSSHDVKIYFALKTFPLVLAGLFK